MPASFIPWTTCCAFPLSMHFPFGDDVRAMYNAGLWLSSFSPHDDRAVLQCTPHFLRRQRQTLDSRAATPGNRVGNRGSNRNNAAFAQAFGTVRAGAIAVFNQH